MDPQLTDDDINKLLRGFSIPSQPQILVDLQMAQAQNPPDLHEISRLIRKDIYASGSVLKVANSPFYGLRKPVTSIEHAIMMIGTQGVINIVNAVTLRQELVSRKPLSEEDSDFLSRFWDSAEDTARVAAAISREIDLGHPDELYLLGLFHNAGIPLMIERYGDYRQVIVQSYELADGTITEVENRHYDSNHAVLGYYLTRSWKMPKLICDTIGQHHNLQLLLSDELLRGGPMLNMLTILKLAEHIVGLYFVLGGHTLDQEWLTTKDALMTYLNLSDEDLDDLVHLCRELGIVDQVQAA
jgi:HD-like signal output (HDOD) protein